MISKRKYNSQILIIAFLCTYLSFAQNEFSNWYFGENAGISFSSNPPTALVDSEINSLEGSATISDCYGNLLFYTDGVDVWNKEHNIMQNGSGLLGDTSSSQAAVIVPKPGSTELYYIFTVDAQAGANGFTYSEVNMSLSNGNGNITNNKNIQLHDSTTEKLTVAPHSNGNDYWVIVHEWNSSSFLSYLVTNLGVNTIPVISSVGATHSGSVQDTIGCMKVSPNSEKIAIAKVAVPNNRSIVQIFDFDNTTGTISNLIFISEEGLFYDSTYNGAYGIEFSPDSSILYVSDNNFSTESKIHQFDISLESQIDIINSDVIIYQGSNLLGSLQLGIDNKIYIASLNATYLSSIENPNLIGESCGFIEESVFLNGRSSLFSLPQFSLNTLNLEIIADGSCNGDVNAFSVNFNESIDFILWDFGDGNTSTEESPNHIYNDPGIYNVNVTIEYGVLCKSKNISVSVVELFNLDFVSNYELCDDESNDGIELFNLYSYNELTFQDLGEELNVTYHLNESDAENGVNSLSQNFFNTENNQELFFRIEILANNGCYQVGSFFLIVQEYGVFEGDEVSVDITVKEWSPNNNSITINAEANGLLQYSLNNILYQDTPYFENLNAGVYNVYIKGLDQCGVYKRQISILNAPSYFTPNGDGINDLWQIKLASKRPGLITYIYNRYGKLITILKASDYGWDGTYNGKRLSQSDYWYVAKSENDSVENKGHFTLKR